MTTALLVIDVQESFRVRPNWKDVSNPDIVASVNTLVAASRRAGEPVIWILHAEPGSGGVFDPAGDAVVLQPGLHPEPADPVLTKTSRNAFTTTRLGQYLTAHGITRLRISGIQTEQCCETTARIAADLGYDVEFVIDATATFPVTHWSDPSRTLGTADIIERTEYALATRFATITRTADYLTGAAPR